MADLNVVLIVNPHTFSDPRPIPNLQLPRKLNPGAGSKDDMVPNVRSKKPENSNSEI